MFQRAVFNILQYIENTMWQLPNKRVGHVYMMIQMTKFSHAAVRTKVT